MKRKTSRMKAAKLSDPAEVVSANIKSDVFMPLCLNSVHNYCDDHVELSAILALAS